MKLLKNSNGYTLVELMAVIAILGILSGMAIIGYGKYIDSSTKKAQEIFLESIISASENYKMDHPVATSVTVADLINQEYLEKPSNEKITRGTENYRGKVIITEKENKGGINTYYYKVSMCFDTSEYFTYDTETKTKTEDETCQAD